MSAATSVHLPQARLTPLTQELDDTLRSFRRSISIGGNFNTMALDWGTSETNSRSQLILEIASRLGSKVLYEGTTTFGRDLPLQSS